MKENETKNKALQAYILNKCAHCWIGSCSH